MDDLGDRIKSYESQETHRRLMPGIPIYARLDGRSFSKFTKHMARPYDELMSATMLHVTKHVVQASGATLGYTASDEISLAWVPDDHTQELWFGGKIHKWHSVLASMVTCAFVQGVVQHFPNAAELLTLMPQFDCRVMQVPNLHELANCFLWRNLDAQKNAISQAAHVHLGHAACDHKNSAEKLMMLREQGVQFDAYPAQFQRGAFVRKQHVKKPFDAQAWASIPIQHRPPLGELILRSEIMPFDLPPLNLITNRPEVLFRGAQPELKETT